MNNSIHAILKNTFFKYAFLSFLLLFALLRIRQTYITYSDVAGIDYRNVYLGSRLLHNHADPYDDQLLKKTWTQIVEAEHLHDKTVTPGLPDLPLLYQPYTLLLFTPLALLPYSVSLVLWLCFCLICISVTLALFLKHSSLTKEAQLITWLVCIGGTIVLPIVLVGQPTCLFIASGFLSLYYYEQQKKIPAAVWLFLTFCKPPLALPFLMYYVLKHEWRLLAGSTGILLMLHLLLMVFGHSLADLYMGNMELVRIYRETQLESFVSDRLYFENTRFSTELLIVIQYFFRGFSSIANVVNLLLLTIGFISVYVLYRKGRIPGLKAFLVLSVITLLLTHHLYYDQILLLPVILVLPLNGNRWTSYLLLCFIATTFLPLQNILISVQHYSMVWLYKPVMLMALLYWLIREKIRRNHFFTNNLKESGA